MGALKAIAAALTLVASILSFGVGAFEGEGARSSDRWRPLASEAADRFGLPVEWVLRVIDAESAGRTTLGGEPITSHAGAMGLMQIMPATWASLRAQYRLGPDPHDPRDNIVAGTAYLRAMYDLFGYPGLFGAYNAGPGRYGDYVARGRPLPRETRDYMAKIVGGEMLARSARAARSAGQISVPAGRGGVAGTAADPIFLSRKSAPHNNPLSVESKTAAAVRTAERDGQRALVTDRRAGPDTDQARTADSIFALRRRGREGNE